MAVYTELSVDEVAAFFGALGLGWPRSVRGITTGIENTNYFVDTETGEYVLTLFERLTFEQLPFYLHFIKHLATRRMPVPDPVANVKGEILHSLKDRPAVVVNRLPGESVTAPSAEHCRAIGAILARLHLAGSDYPRRQANPRGLEWWNEVVPVVGQYVSDGQRSLLTSELTFQNQIAVSSTYEQLPSGPVHADLFRDNVLFAGSHLTGVFDFYFAGCDAFLFDIAVCLNDWCVDDCTGRQDSERAAAFLGAYESVRVLTPAERILLPAMQRAGAFRFWLSRLWDLYQPREAAILKAHDPSHFERMLCVHRGEIV
ncbi:MULTISPECIES: homoserine kinase [unclassified Mesorhizobium]|uniref:homoserine kinase n=1 Tax=unclassified Mesorhizobium TaxID=325217 RepID=UPI00112DED4C|nr:MULTISPECIES: homoserine kinase [unclassified Mesorhizobium]TPM07430.1 homoserine kinase [Mesorhizobium sp. B2-3-8]TPM16140.1 homoserine kinase [Mesorhizobium sp. B2-3-7]